MPSMTILPEPAKIVSMPAKSDWQKVRPSAFERRLPPAGLNNPPHFILWRFNFGRSGKNSCLGRVFVLKYSALPLTFCL